MRLYDKKGRRKLGRISCVMSLGLLPGVSTPADAQRRPGMNMGFYTTTDLRSGDIEAGSVTATTGLSESPTLSASALLTTALRRQPKRAWILGLRTTLVEFGRRRDCLQDFRTGECLSRRYAERASVVAGGAFDIRSTILRVVVGPVLYSVEDKGARIGAQIRVDFASPRLRGPTPTLFISRSVLGSERGRAVGTTTLGAGLRWVRKTSS